MILPEIGDGATEKPSALLRLAPARHCHKTAKEAPEGEVNVIGDEQGNINYDPNPSEGATASSTAGTRLAV